MDNNEKKTIGEQVVYGTVTEPKKSNGPGIAGFVMGIVSLVLSWLGGLLGILAVPGLILSIVGMNKKRSKKGFAIAGLVLNIISLITNVIVFVLIVVPAIFIILGTTTLIPAVMAPQMSNYIQKTKTAQETYEMDLLDTAMTTVLLDPSIYNADDYYIIEMYMDGYSYRVSDIPEGTYRNLVEEVLGSDLDEYSDYWFSYDASNYDILITK